MLSVKPKRKWHSDLHKSALHTQNTHTLTEMDYMKHTQCTSSVTRMLACTCIHTHMRKVYTHTHAHKHTYAQSQKSWNVAKLMIF